MSKCLLFGGGGCHDYRSICPVLKEYLAGVDGLAVDYVAEDFDALRAERLAPYDSIVLYYTGGELPLEAKRGLVEGVAAGKGFVGVHAATCCFEKSPEYLAMVGGVFRAHPFIRDYLVSLTPTAHPVTAGIAGYTVKDWEKWPVFEFPVKDEQYLIDGDSRNLLLATTVFRGVTWPVAWVKAWGKGKVFYLALGHDLEACRNLFFRQMLVNGVRWASDPAAELPGYDKTRFAI